MNSLLMRKEGANTNFSMFIFTSRAAAFRACSSKPCSKAGIEVKAIASAVAVVGLEPCVSSKGQVSQCPPQRNAKCKCHHT